jgi:uncharacterized protein (DUF58 family)
VSTLRQRLAGAARAVADAARAVFRWMTGLLPSPRQALLIALTAPVWLLLLLPGGAPWVALALVVLACVVLYDALTLPAAWQFTVERRAPETVGIGDAAEAEFEVQSLAGRAIRFSLHDALPRGVERLGDLTGAGGESVAAHGVRAVPFTLVGRERGSWPLGPVSVRVRGRLDLVRRTFRQAPGDAVRVTPSMTGVRRYRLLALQHRLRDAGVRAVRRRGDGTNFANLREYVVGDDPRHIDWKATARRHKLITREFTVEQGQTVLVAVDAGRMMTQLAGELSRFEHALSSATLLADVATQSGDQVGAIVFDDQVRAFVPAARGRPALQRLRDAFVPAKATMTEPDYAAAFRTLAARHRKRSLIVLYTDVVDPRASQALIALTARSAMRHVLVVVALRNDALMAAAVPTRESTSDQLYESAAAEELVMAREAALAKMRHAGVSVLDVSPRLMTAAVINRYLEIKARASL